MKVIQRLSLIKTLDENEEKKTQIKKQSKQQSRFFYIQISISPKKQFNFLDNLRQNFQNRTQENDKKYFLREELEQYSILTQYFINEKLFTRYVTKIYRNNGIEFSIISKNQRLLCAKFFNRLVSNQKSNSRFVINLATGTIALTLSTLNAQQQQPNLQKQIEKMHESMKQIAPKVFEFNHEMIKRSYQDINSKRCNYKYVHFTELTDIRKKIESFIIASGIKYKFMQNINFKYSKATKAEECDDNLYKFRIEKLTHHQKLLNMYFQKKLQTKSIEDIQNLISLEENTIKKYLFPPIAKTNSTEKTNLFSRIKILEEEKLKFDNKFLLYISESSTIYRFNLKYSLQDDNNQKGDNIIQKLLIAKKQNQSYPFIRQKKQNEIEIYKTIKDQTCVHITRAYFSNSDRTKNYFWADYYMYGSLENYSRLMNKSLSILTKIYLIIHIVQGLRFLQQNKIVHRDKSNKNKLIGKSVILRLNDFKQSFSYKITNPRKQKQNIRLEDDVKDLGILIFEFLFNKSPMQIKYGQNKAIRGTINPDNVSFQFVLNELISLIYFKCVYESHDNKPKLQWLIIILRQLLNFFQQLY